MKKRCAVNQCENDIIAPILYEVEDEATGDKAELFFCVPHRWIAIKLIVLYSTLEKAEAEVVELDES